MHSWLLLLHLLIRWKVLYVVDVKGGQLRRHVIPVEPKTRDDDELFRTEVRVLQHATMSMKVSQNPSSTPTVAPSSSVSLPTPTPTRANATRTWRPVGSLIRPLSDGSVGYDIDLSADGSSLLVGVPGDAPGYNAFYDFEHGDWTERGAPNSLLTLPGDAVLDSQFSSTVALNGNVVAAGARGSSDRLYAGHVAAFVWNDTAWNFRGPEVLVGSGLPCRNFGWSVDLADDGKRLVVGEPGNLYSFFDCNALDDSQADYPGAVYIYDYDEVTERWATPFTLDFSSTGVRHGGQAVALSRNGERLAVVAQRDDGAVFRVYEPQMTGEWTQIGQDILTEWLEVDSRSLSQQTAAG